MKYLLSALVLLAMAVFGGPTWGWGSTVPVPSTPPPSYRTPSFTGLGTATEEIPEPEIPLPIERFPGATLEKSVDAALLPQSLNLSGVDVGIDLFVQEAAEGPTSVYGIGLMLDFDKP